ncbi:N-acetyl-beta-glucosaminyl-glycoprotein 4-beta-N-acetylgalactosaminyltransferase 1 isoform X2 [Oryzias latipes]
MADTSAHVHTHDDDSIAAGSEGRDHAYIRKFLSQQNKKTTWKAEFKGQANLHVFEDWCGSSVGQLRKNLHFPLFPHTRTTVKKLAVAPRWKNYGLRIFGFLHPYKDGDFQFSVSSDDNSEFWLSLDESPLNARLLVYVGQLGTEWTAPGEFNKFRSQSSKSVHLISSRRYYFEILHKQDDKGSDHVEVGWRPFLPGLKYEVIDSAYISLYADESSLKMNSVEHIPQTMASHARLPEDGGARTPHGADMLKPDPRDSFHSLPMIDRSRLDNVLPSCIYSPTYVVKDFPIARYQGLQFVYLSFVYPNDFTRLTHMERENKCFYRESPIYLEKFGFYKYMKMDEEEDDRLFFFPNPDDLAEEEAVDTEDEAEIVGTQSPKGHAHSPSSSSHQQSKNVALPTGVEEEEEDPREADKDTIGNVTPLRGRRQFPGGPTVVGEGSDPGVKRNTDASFKARSLSWIDPPATIRKDRQTDAETPKLSKSSLLYPPKPPLAAVTRQISSNSVRQKPPQSYYPAPSRNRKEKRDENKTYITRPRSAKGRGIEGGLWHDGQGGQASRRPREVFPGVFLYQMGRTTRLVHLGAKGPVGLGVTGIRRLIGGPPLWPNPPVKEGRARHHGPSKERRDSRTDPPEKDPLPNLQSHHRESAPALAPSQRTDTTRRAPAHQERVTSYLRTSEITERHPDPERNRSIPNPDPEPEPDPEEGDLSDYSYEEVGARPGWAEESINWQRTFSVNPNDFETLRSDWNDLRCNVSGNLQLAESEVVDVLAQFMEKLNERNGGIYTLLRIVNVEKRRDSARGNRYLVELELMERGRSVVRLSEYIYLLLHRSKHGEESRENTDSALTSPLTLTTPPSHTPSSSSARAAASPASTAYAKPLLCQPLALRWRRDVMVHFVVPVKNQARWVQQFISDMEELHRQTQDDNFSIIIVDFESEDMDVEKALRQSGVPRYEYLRRGGNFERSAGLQIGVDTIEDSHSIVFLCDLHIHFPPNILESIRKHCVEGRLAFAPIVMRLSCGSSPLEPDGYWEVNGFGLFGIYKSDFDKVGGMNTEEFKDRWGGEDWELLDRVMQNGLEVERLRLRNFFHYYHSKRGMWNAQNKKPLQGLRSLPLGGS